MSGDRWGVIVYPVTNTEEAATELLEHLDYIGGMVGELSIGELSAGFCGDNGCTYPEGHTPHPHTWES
jgi:hypothetical protein